MMMTYKRTDLLNELMRWRDLDLVKVITGVRRAGKSSLLLMVCETLKKEGIPENRIAYINFEDRRNMEISTPKQVWDELDRQLSGTGKKYIFLDEIQRINHFEEFVDAAYADKNYDVYMTGSNAWMLSGDLATYLSGRYIEFNITPLSFAEFMDEAKWDSRDGWRRYVRYGSFPYVRTLVENGMEPGVNDYLEGIFNTVLMKDVALRTKMSDVGTLRRIAGYLFDNVGNLTSVKRIADVLSSQGGKVSYHAAESYVQSLCDAFIMYKCERVDVKGAELLRNGAKYYAVDPGLRYYLNGNRAGDEGRVLENIVYLELRRRCRNVFVGRTHGGREIDFVTRDGDRIAYYQVAETVKSEETLKRELGALLDIHDNYPKFLITGDDQNPVMHNGIRQLFVGDFLLRKA